MGLFFVYILKSSVCLAIFYLFYRLLLARETFHRFNRFSLLGILLLSCLLPLVEVSVKQETEVHQTMLTLEQLLMMADAVNATEAGASAETATVTWDTSGAACLSGRNRFLCLPQRMFVGTVTDVAEIG